MGVSEIIASVDREITLLKQVRALLTGSAATTKKTAKPAKSAAKSTPSGKTLAKKATGRKKKRRLSPEGRKRIAEAVKRRWAKQRKAAASK